MEVEVDLEVIPQFVSCVPSPYDFDELISDYSQVGRKEILDLDRSMDGDVLSHFPVILIDGLPWRHSTNYLLKRAQDFDAPKPKTILGIARDLRDFKVWVIGFDVDYLKCVRAVQSPVRRYKRYLNTTSYSPNVIRRKLSRVVAFYRWLQDEEKIVFEKSLWEEREFKVLTTTATGNRLAIDVKSTDVQDVKGRSQTKGIGYDGYIQDGGLLRPYSLEEQKTIIKCLEEIGNTEMTLSFLLALSTGARLQTIFTLRQCHFERMLGDSENEVILYVGRWPEKRVANEVSEAISISKLVDTKNSKPMKLYIPRWVYQRIQVYLKSDRYLRRALRKFENGEKSEYEYLFLTTRARPFYMHSEDPLAINYQNPPQGASVQQFISSQLKPRLSDSGFAGHFKFHNLRATYGMNIVRSYMPLIDDDNGFSLTELFAIVQTKMGHSNQQTTQQYLSFDLKQEVASSIQGSYEHYLESLFSEMKEEWKNA